MSEIIVNPDIQKTLALKEELLEIKNEFMGLKKELGEVTYQLMSLYDRWVVEHQLVGRREAEMSRSMEAFAQQMEGLEAKVQKNIQTTASQAMVMVGDIVGKETKKHFESEIGSIAKRLENMVDKVENFVPEYTKVKESTAMRAVVIAILVSFLIGCGIGAWWVASNTMSVDKLRKILK